MKKLLSICVFTLLTTLLTAQVSKTINVTTAGTLTNLLTATEKTTVTDLTVTGSINETDVKCIRDEISLLSVLDFSNSTIIDNYLPTNSFYNSFTDKGKTTLKSVKLPNNTTIIGASAFKKCSGLTDVIIPNAVTEISDFAFQSCSGLTNLIIPNSVSYIDGMTFYACSGLNTVTLGNSLSRIGYMAFGGGCEIKTIYSLNTIPPTIDAQSFPSYSTVISVFVPSSAVATYKAASGWSDCFSSVIKDDGSSTTFNITVQIGIGGTVKENDILLTDGSVLIANSGSSKTFSITPIAGYEIASLIYSGLDVKSQISNNQYTTPTVNANATLNATFRKIQYRVSLKDASTGTMNLICDYGATPSFDFTPTTGWRVNTILYNSVDVTSSLLNGIYTLPAITANALLNVSFVSSANGAPEVINNRVKVYGTNSEIIVDGTSEGETVTLYTVNGKQIQTVMSKGERLNLSVDRNTIYLVKTGEKIFKVIL